MKTYHFLLVLSFFILVNSCGSIHKKHYDNGFTFIKHKKKSSAALSAKTKDLQQKSLNEISQEIKKEKQQEQKIADETYHSYHKTLDKIQNHPTSRLLSSINKFSLRQIKPLKTDTLYRKEPIKKSSMPEEVNNKARTALVLAIISIVVFWFLFILSLIPALIALSMARKAESMAKLYGDSLPSDANTAKIIAWVTIGLNLLMILLIILYVILLLLLLGYI
jgi:uncharacterized protein YcfL